MSIEFTVTGHVPDTQTLLKMIDAMHAASPLSADFTVSTQRITIQKHADDDTDILSFEESTEPWDEDGE
jgi:hypothetical protein